MTQEHALHPAREHRYITTFSGQRVKSTAVHPSQINRSDMLRGLAMQVRYLGQIRDFYSIAEHSVLVSRIAEAYNEPTDVLRAALLHDGHEYLTGDFPSPYKYDVDGLRPWERSIEGVFREAMGLPPNEHPVWTSVKRYDLIALHFEARNLMIQDPGWIDDTMVALAPQWASIGCYDWRKAASIFRSRAYQLGLDGFQGVP